MNYSIHEVFHLLIVDTQTSSTRLVKLDNKDEVYNTLNKALGENKYFIFESDCMKESTHQTIYGHTWDNSKVFTCIQHRGLEEEI